MSTGITFNSNSLQTANIHTADIDHGGMPEKDANLYPLAHANKSVIPLTNYPSRVIRISGKIIGSSIADLDSRIDTFKQYFVEQDKNLDIDYNGSTRRYIATVKRLEISRPGGLFYTNFSIDFICSQPFGQATTATTANTETNQTGATDTFTHTYLGTAPYQLPVITITIDSVTAGDGHITLSNNANNQGITVIGQTFVAADVLEIDSKNRTVKLNGTEIDFLGSFIEIAPGSQQINYEDGFTARQFDITIAYYPLYL